MMELKETRPVFHVGPIPVYGDLILSPMDGYSDQPFRSLARSLGSAMSYTEFINAIDVLFGHPHLERKLTFLESDSLIDCRVVVIGLGLMGGSLAMALRGKCKEIIGIDSDPETVALALEWGVVDRASTQAIDLLPQADVLILAVPVRAILTLLKALPDLHPGKAIVMDLGSTKQAVMSAMAALPDRFDPLGGHPMCGKEKNSLRYAEGELFLSAPFALAALDRTSQQAKRLGEELVRAVGACPLWVKPADHDRWVAATSHVPYLIASTLARSTPTEAAGLVGPGFRSTTRLAGSSTRMMADILMTNRDNIRAAIHRFQTELDHCDDLLDRGAFEELTVLLEQGLGRYKELCA